MNFTFSPEEMAALKECDVEALVQRSIPLGTIFGVGTWAAVQRGFLQKGGFGGTGAKIFAASMAGYFLGKLSYQQRCAEKLMRLPNSRLGDALRRRKKGEFFETFTQDGGLSMAPFSSATDVYTDENLKSSSQNNSLDIDTDRPANFGLDDTYRPSVDSPDRSFNDNLPLEPPKTQQSYEELRRRNREDYERRMSTPFNRQQQPLPREDAPSVYRAQPERDESFQQGGAKNKYGDVWK